MFHCLPLRVAMAGVCWSMTKNHDLHVINIRYYNVGICIKMKIWWRLDWRANVARTVNTMAKWRMQCKPAGKTRITHMIHDCGSYWKNKRCQIMCWYDSYSRFSNVPNRRTNMWNNIVLSDGFRSSPKGFRSSPKELLLWFNLRNRWIVIISEHIPKEYYCRDLVKGIIVQIDYLILEGSIEKPER